MKKTRMDYVTECSLPLLFLVVGGVLGIGMYIYYF